MTTKQLVFEFGSKREVFGIAYPRELKLTVNVYLLLEYVK